MGLHKGEAVREQVLFGLVRVPRFGDVQPGREGGVRVRLRLVPDGHTRLVERDIHAAVVARFVVGDVGVALGEAQTPLAPLYVPALARLALGPRGLLRFVAIDSKGRRRLALQLARIRAQLHEAVICESVVHHGV